MQKNSKNLLRVFKIITKKQVVTCLSFINKICYDTFSYCLFYQRINAGQRKIILKVKKNVFSTKLSENYD